MRYSSMPPTIVRSIAQAMTRTVLLCSLCLLASCDATSNAQLPDLHLTTVKNTQIQTAAPSNKVTLVSFWATSCKSCVEEMPALIETYQQYQPKGLEIIAVSMTYDPPAQLMSYVEQKALPFPVVHDSYGDIAREFGEVHATPTAYLYNQAGQRIDKTIGILNFKKLHTILDQELS